MARASNDYLDKSDEELAADIADKKAELFNLRFQAATGQLDNTARLRQAKKDVARRLTEYRSREIAAYEALQASAQNEESA